MPEIELPKGLPQDAIDALKSIIHDTDRCVQAFFRIKDKAGKLVDFRYNRPQILHAERSTDFDVVLKARKMGISSRRIARDLWICATQRNQHRILLTHTDDAAVKMLQDRVKPLIANCKFPLGAIPRQDHIYFPLTGSRYYVATAGSKTYGRGDDITGYHFSEEAHWESPTVIGGIEEALIDGADGLIETTANGYNFFRALWLKAKRGENRYRAIFLPWFAAEEYKLEGVAVGPLSEEERAILEEFKLSESDIAWRRNKIKTMSDPALFPQEYPENDNDAFLSSGRPVFDRLALARLKAMVGPPKFTGYLVRKQERIEFVPDPKGWLRVWKIPENYPAQHVYAIGSDVAEGLSDGAYSTGEVIDLGDGEQVAELHEHCAPDILADHLELLAGWYNQAIIIPEAWPGPGEVTTTCLLPRTGVKVWEDINHPDRPGWHTSEKSKTLAISTLNRALRDHELTIRSPELLEELHSFVYDDRGRMGPSAGNFSDRVMGLAIGFEASRDMASRVDYYRARRPILLGESPVQGRGGTTVPKYEGRRY